MNEYLPLGCHVCHKGAEFLDDRGRPCCPDHLTGDARQWSQIAPKDDMIPRITLRDYRDAEVLYSALRIYLEARIGVNNLASRQPGADQIKLSLDLIEETRYLCELIEAIGDGIMDPEPTDSPDPEEDDDNGI
jgi:hypothetical protein